MIQEEIERQERVKILKVNRIPFCEAPNIFIFDNMKRSFDIHFTTKSANFSKTEQEFEVPKYAFFVRKITSPIGT